MNENGKRTTSFDHLPANSESKKVQILPDSVNIVVLIMLEVKFEIFSFAKHRKSAIGCGKALKESELLLSSLQSIGQDHSFPSCLETSRNSEYIAEI